MRCLEERRGVRVWTCEVLCRKIMVLQRLSTFLTLACVLTTKSEVCSRFHPIIIQYFTYLLRLFSFICFDSSLSLHFRFNEVHDKIMFIYFNTANLRYISFREYFIKLFLSGQDPHKIPASHKIL